jgi:hypothetical protein
MANLTRWKRRIPKWEGNELEAEPFAVECKRLTVDERAAMRERIGAIHKRESVETFGAVLGDYIRGPLGVLTIDGAPAPDTIPALVDSLATVDPIAYRALIDCLVDLVVEVNSPGGAAGGQ